MVDLLRKSQEEILRIIHSKGWNLYDSTGVKSKDEARIALTEGPATELAYDRRYVLLPKVSESKDPDKIWGRLDEVGKTIDDRMLIKVEGAYYDWTGFIPHQEDVKVNTFEGHYIPYPEFIRSLETILNIT